MGLAHVDVRGPSDLDSPVRDQWLLAAGRIAVTPDKDCYVTRHRLKTLIPASLAQESTGFIGTAPWAWNEATETQHESPLATFLPVNYEPAYAYPLIVWLHSPGSSERELPQVMRHVSVQNFLAVGPRGSVKREGNHWAWSQTAEGIAAAESSVAEAIESAADRFRVHTDRVFIAGVGSGGTMALRLALQRPEWFAGAVSLDGPLPKGHQPLSRVNVAREVPLLLSASRESKGYTQPLLCSDLALLHSAGCRVAIRQYPGDDDLTTAMLADVNRWIMEQVCA